LNNVYYLRYHYRKSEETRLTQQTQRKPMLHYAAQTVAGCYMIGGCRTQGALWVRGCFPKLHYAAQNVVVWYMIGGCRMQGTLWVRLQLVAKLLVATGCKVFVGA
jgi:hypothetical protein